MSTSSAWRWVLCLALVIGGASGCSSLLYRPNSWMYAPDETKLEDIREEFFFSSRDGTQLAGWILRTRTQPVRGTVIQFHGNAQNLTSHFQSLQWLVREGYNLVTFDYRGYGISQGSPHPEGVHEDATAALRWVIAEGSLRVSTQAPDLFPYGQSLGGAVLLRALGELTPEERARIALVTIEGSFHSYQAIARDVLSRKWTTWLFQPLASLLISDAWSPEAFVEKVSPIPLLIIHGDKDVVVPPGFGEKLFTLAREPKKHWRIAEGTHIDLHLQPTRNRWLVEAAEAAEHRP